MAERGAAAPQLGLLSALSAHALLYTFPNANSPGLLWSSVDSPGPGYHRSLLRGLTYGFLSS